MGKITDDKQPAGWNYDKYLLQHHQAGLYQHTLDRIEQDEKNSIQSWQKLLKIKKIFPHIPVRAQGVDASFYWQGRH